MATFTPTQTKQDEILGTLLVELLRGELSDQTIAKVDQLDRNDVPDAFKEIVGFMHGMSTEPSLRYGVITSLIREIQSACVELAEERDRNQPPIHA